MKKFVIFVCVFPLVLMSFGSRSRAQLEIERKEMREDVRQLMNDMDSVGDMDRYGGSDYFERLHAFAYDE